jgi:hypothetical protein
MKGKGGSMKRRQTEYAYPWTPVQGSDPVAVAQRAIVIDRLSELQYPLNMPPPDETTLRISNTMLDMLGHDESTWVILFSNNATLLSDIADLVATSYALTWGHSVQPVDSRLIRDLANGFDPVFGALPFGVSALESSGLIVFPEIVPADDSLRKVHGYTSRLFKKWARSWVSLFATSVYTGEWSVGRVDDFASDVGYYYGEVAESLVRRKAKIAYHDDPTKPASTTTPVRV